MSKRYRGLRIKRTSRVTTAALTVATFALLVWACTPADFGEYEGVDFLEAYGFDSPDWSADQSAPYLLFEEVDPAITAEIGLPDGFAIGDPGTAVYRLEVLNLIPNGDFENDTLAAIGITPPGWSEGGGSAAVVANTGSVSGNYELSVSVANGAWVAFDFEDSTGGAIDGLIPNAFYALRFDFDPGDVTNYQFQYDNTVDNTPPDLPRWESLASDDTIDYAFPFDFEAATAGFSASTEQNSFTIVENLQVLDIDNLRLVRTDIPLSIRLSIPYSGPNRPVLISGTYTFSFFVHQDPTAGRLAASEYLNRYRAQAVSFGVESSVTVNTEGFTAESGDAVDFSGWYRASTDVFVQVDHPSDPNADALEVYIAASDITGNDAVDAGSILITAPSLTYSPH